jgi:glycine oxidase
MAMGDITVFGAGAFGLSVAWACTRRGARVTVVDPGGVAAGASGGVLGALAPHAPDNWTPIKDFQLDALLMAGRFWAEVEAAGGIDPHYRRAGRLQPIPDAAALERARTRAERAGTLWRGQALWEVIPASGAPWEPASATGFLIRDTLSAQLEPRAACAALAAAIRARGGAIVADAPGGDAPQIWATGWQGLERLSREFGRPVGGGVKGQAMVLGFTPPPPETPPPAHPAPPGAGRPQIFADGVHVVAHAGGRVAVGSTSERDWTTPTATDAGLDTVHARAIAALPILAGAAVLERWAGVRPRAASRMPVLGAHPHRSGVFVANGGFKIGFGLAPLVGEIMADLVLDGCDRIPAPFRLAG